MTPHEAGKRLEELSETARKHPRKARRKTIELLCEIARKNGFYRCADFYETFKDEDWLTMIPSLFYQLVVTVRIGAHPLTYTLPRLYWALQAPKCVAKGQWLLEHVKPGLEMDIYCVRTDKRDA